MLILEEVRIEGVYLEKIHIFEYREILINYVHTT